MTTVRRLTIAVLSVLALVGMVGCDPTPILYKTVAIGSPIVAGGYRSLDAADKDAQDKIRAMDKAPGKAALTVHLERYDHARLALDTTMATAQTALDSAPAWKAAHDKKATMDLVGTLLKLYEDVRAALAPFGIDIPKVSL